ncbi:uncharacterized protein [Henckelia pumila]|uniref:uncharacterized protein n=1 Tax=Henckelia pumila TaxID=405737 RepID=UPI003C6E6791
MAPRRDPHAPPPPPPPVDVGAQMLDGLARIFEQHAEAPRARPSAIYEQFRKMDPKDFSGTTDPMVAERWIRSLEAIFRYMELGDGDRVHFMMFLLKDDAALWFEGVEKTVDEKYYTAEVREQLKKEFMSLRQGDLSISEFVRKFERGCHFVPLIGNDEAEKLQHFVSCLMPTIRRDGHQQQQGKRPFTGPQRQQGPFRPQGHLAQRPQGHHAQRPQGHQAQRPAPPKTGEKPRCMNCNCAHHGKCLAGAGVCFWCKKPGHIAPDCPQHRMLAQGRVFVMQAEEADPDTTLITGRILVAGVATIALLDSGATHSFISEAFTCKRGIECEELFGGFTMTIPSGEELSTRNIVKNLELLLQGQSVSADLIVLSMPEFDMILGMDWMRKNVVVIDFQQRSVMVRPEGEESFWFETTRGSRRTQIISFMQAKQLVHDGGEAFLASISLTELPARPDISDVDIVRDFEDVFLGDVAGIPPDIEVEFSIDLGREEHSQHLKTVLEVLRERKLFAKFDKCEFWLERVALLGHIISKNGVEVDPSKVQAVKEWSIPRIASEIRSFLRLAGYYRKFIKGFSSIAVPLKTLTKKNAKFIWKTECQKSFDVLKEALTTAPVLAMPSGKGDFVVKAEHQRPAGLLKPLPIPEWKWENITMDFFVGLPRTVRGSNAIWVIVDRLTKSAHFLPVRTNFSMTQYAELYIREIVRLHGIPVSIVSDKNPRFTSTFWKSLHSALGKKLLFSTDFHPHTDGQSERVIQILEDLLRACVIDFDDSWESRLPLVEFAYNNSYQTTIGMAPYKALYGRPCRSPVLWTEIGERSELDPRLFSRLPRL